MEDRDIFNALCDQDTFEDPEYRTGKPEDKCYCESCHRGTTQLAEYILELKGISKQEFINKNS